MRPIKGGPPFYLFGLKRCLLADVSNLHHTQPSSSLSTTTAPPHHTLTYTYREIHMGTHVQAYTHTHARTSPHTHTHAHTHTAHTHARTHTHNYLRLHGDSYAGDVLSADGVFFCPGKLL